MRLGMMLNDGGGLHTDGSPTYDATYKRPGGIILPVIKKPSYEVGTDVFIIYRDPVTGEIYDSGPRTEEPIPKPPEPKTLETGNVDPNDGTPLPIQVNVATTSPPRSEESSLIKPLLIGGAVVAAFLLLKD